MFNHEYSNVINRARNFMKACIYNYNIIADSCSVSSTVLWLTCHVDDSLYHQSHFLTEDVGIAKHDKNTLHYAIVVLPQGRQLESVERIVPAGIWIGIVSGSGRNESAP